MARRKETNYTDLDFYNMTHKDRMEWKKHLQLMEGIAIDIADSMYMLSALWEKRQADSKWAVEKESKEFHDEYYNGWSKVGKLYLELEEAFIKLPTG